MDNISTEQLVRSRGPSIWLLCSVLLSTTGCASSLLNLSAPGEFGSKFAEMFSSERPRVVEKEEDNDFDNRIETPLLRDYISVTGNNLIPLRGVGLVTGLDGTGGDPPPSHLRKELLDEMNRRKIPNPQRILASRNTALVMVTAYLPAMVQREQKFDVRVTLPPNSEATSLKGGWLLETRLSEERTIAGRGNVKGHQYGIAYGAILTALGSGGYTRDAPAMLRRGSIPGGATSMTERDLEIILRNDYRGLKTSKRIESAISGRLHHYNRFGQRIPMAEAKTDLMLELKMHPLYRNNFPRYQQMIRSIALRESDVARRMRMEKLASDIMEPDKAADSALQLEAIGRDSIPFLQAALKSDSLEVRFHAAQSLAYMEDSSGVEVLKQAVEEEPAFRVYGLAALSVIQDADGIVAMRELLSSDTLETRYGAVRALKENNPNDQSLGTQEFDNRFILHAVDSTGPSAVHVVRYRSPEVVVFGSKQHVQLPLFLNLGNRIQVIGNAGEHKVTITKYDLNKDPVRQVSSTNLVEIIETAASLGATYPDVVQMLLEADRQRNLAGELGIDRLPQAGRAFSRNFGNGNSQKAKLGTPSLTPGLFDRLEESEQDREQSQSPLAEMLTMRDEDEPATSSDDPESAEVGVADMSSFDLSDIPDTPGLDAAAKSLTGAKRVPRPPTDSEEPAEDSDDDFKLEKSEFKVPLRSRMRQMFFSPFQSK